MLLACARLKNLNTYVAAVADVIATVDGCAIAIAITILSRHVIIVIVVTTTVAVATICCYNRLLWRVSLSAS